METWKQTKLGPPDFKILDWDAMREDLRAETYDDKWETAIAGIEGRFRERFIKPADSVQEHDKNDNSTFPEGRGFAIVAIDCLLLESLYGYETGKRTKTSGETSAAFEDMLTTSALFKDAFADGRAKTFGAAVRNGILHDGETRYGWIIWQGWEGGPLVDPRPDGRIVLYRDPFHAAVKTYLAEYFVALRKRADPKSTGLRVTFLKRVDDLCKDSKPKT